VDGKEYVYVLPPTVVLMDVKGCGARTLKAEHGRPSVFRVSTSTPNGGRWTFRFLEKPDGIWVTPIPPKDFDKGRHGGSVKAVLARGTFLA
jgi:hypothetical protein